MFLKFKREIKLKNSKEISREEIRLYIFFFKFRSEIKQKINI